MTQPLVNPQSPEEIGKRLKKLRKALGKTQAEMAELAAISKRAWSLIERGSRRIGVGAALRLCDLYGLSLDWIYRGNIAQLPLNIIKKMR